MLQTKSVKPTRNASSTSVKYPISLQPNQPLHVKFPIEQYCIKNNKTISRQFHSSWFQEFPWLEWNEEKQAAFCHPCRTVIEQQINLTNMGDPTFTTDGYGKNWKHAKDRIARHGHTKSHYEAIQQFAYLQRGTNISSMVNTQKEKDRLVATSCLRQLFTTSMYLGKQGLAFRRNDEEEGNFLQLLRLRAEDSSSLRSWLSNHYSYTSHHIQNEMLEQLSRQVLNNVLAKFTKNTFYSILADETSDLSCMEQLSFCLRFVSDEFETVEEFIGLYQLDDCSAETVHEVLQDIVTQCGLSLADCRGLSFDGAATMAGNKSGVAARFQRENPKAIFAYCHMHCLNLCVQDTTADVPIMRDFMSNIQELTNFVRHSPKRMAKLRALNIENSDSSTDTLRLLCPTRMTVKYKALTAIDDQSSTVPVLLHEITIDQSTKPAARTKCSGLVRWLESFDFCFGLTVALELFQMTDLLSAQLQNPKLSAAEGLASALRLMECFQGKRNELHFEGQCKLQKPWSLHIPY